MFAKHFSTIYTNGNSDFQANETSSSIVNIISCELSISEIYSKLSTLNPNKRHVSDGIPPSVLKRFSFILARTLFLIFQKSVTSLLFLNCKARHWWTTIDSKAFWVLYLKYLSPVTDQLSAVLHIMDIEQHFRLISKNINRVESLNLYEFRDECHVKWSSGTFHLHWFLQSIWLGNYGILMYTLEHLGMGGLVSC